MGGRVCKLVTTAARVSQNPRTVARRTRDAWIWCALKLPGLCCFTFKVNYDPPSKVALLPTKLNNLSVEQPPPTFNCPIPLLLLINSCKVKTVSLQKERNFKLSLCEGQRYSVTVLHYTLSSRRCVSWVFPHKRYIKNGVPSVLSVASTMQ